MLTFVEYCNYMYNVYDTFLRCYIVLLKHASVGLVGRSGKPYRYSAITIRCVEDGSIETMPRTYGNK